MENPYLLSVVDAAGSVGINYGVYGVPESFLIDGKGKIVHKFIGPLTSALVQNELLPKLAQLNSSTK
jgi:cytochrome c biogenesis protein CcmG/thiol:disulfide interchange protein DsbE